MGSRGWSGWREAAELSHLDVLWNEKPRPRRWHRGFSVVAEEMQLRSCYREPVVCEAACFEADGVV
jgi:hypothetical protein